MNNKEEEEDSWTLLFFFFSSNLYSFSSFLDLRTILEGVTRMSRLPQAGPGSYFQSPSKTQQNREEGSYTSQPLQPKPLGPLRLALRGHKQRIV